MPTLHHGTCLDQYWQRRQKIPVKHNSILGESVRGGCSVKVMQLERENQDQAAWGFDVRWQLISVYVSLLATEQIIYTSCTTCHLSFKNKDWTMLATIFNQCLDTVACDPKLLFSIIVMLLKVLCSQINWRKVLAEFSPLTAFQHLFSKKTIQKWSTGHQGPWAWSCWRLLPVNRVYFCCRYCHSRALGLCLASVTQSN